MWLTVIATSIFSSFILSSVASPTGVSLTRVIHDAYRLPADVKPSHYKLDLILEENAFETQVFNGKVQITVSIVNSTQEIKIHAKYLEINAVNLYKSDAPDINLATAGPYVPDNQTEILTILTTEELQVNGEYSLSIEYLGTLSDTTMHGFYRSSYEDESGPKYLGITQFEPTHAREAFPSFDEPELKATFEITLNFPDIYNARSNTPAKETRLNKAAGTKTVTFNTTPPMSTYLVAFIVSEFACKEGDSAEDVGTQVCSRPGAQNTVDLAVEVAPKILNEMKEYTGFSFSATNIGKLDQLAIPDFSAGAMENWGLVTFREADLLWDEKESSNVYRQKVITVVAHELAHQWFGDLVTLDWWSDIFLNEGFATYFEYHAAGDQYPELDLINQFVVDEVQSALSADSLKSSNALSYNVDEPEQISNRFDDISYNKGGSILRMVHHLLTLDNFKKGLNGYITARQFNNAEPTDLWTALDSYAQQLPEPQKPPVSLPEAMDNWTNKRGYPLLTVKAQGDDVIITQEKFSLFDDDDKTEWYVPITYNIAGGSRTETNTKAWLIPGDSLTISGVLKNSDWIVLNNLQTGFYRVNYEDSLWSSISKVLNDQSHTDIDQIQKAQLTDDLFNLARSGIKQYEEVFKILTYLENELSYYPWYSAFNGFNYLLNRGGDQLHDSLTDYIRNLMQNLYNSSPFDKENPDDHIYTRRQIQALTWACKLNNKDCLVNADNAFKKYQNNPDVSISKNLRSIVYCYGIQQGDESSWNFLWDRYLATQLSTEQVTILGALGCASDANLLNTYLTKAITGDGIRIQDATSVFSSIYNGPNLEGVDIVFDFITKSHTAIITHFGSTRTLRSLISSVASKFTSQDQLDKLVAFGQTEGLDEEVISAISDTTESVKENLKETAVLEAQLIPYFKNGSAALKSFSWIVSLLFLYTMINTYYF